MPNDTSSHAVEIPAQTASVKWEALFEAMSGNVRRMDYVDRFTSIPVTVRENVSGHSYWVTLYSVMIHNALSAEPELLGPIAVKALIHDLVESETGDLVRTFKYSSNQLRSAVDEAEKGIEEKLPLPIRELYESHVPHEQKHYVKAVVKLADFVSLFQYLNREVNRGNTEISSFVTRMRVDMRTMAVTASKEHDPRIREMSKLYELMGNMSNAIRVARCDGEGDTPVLTFGLEEK